MKPLINATLILLIIIISESFKRPVTKIAYKAKYEIIQPETIEKGKQLFILNGCTACHTNSEQSIGPKLKRIATAYKGKRPQLIKFFNKESKPIVEPADFAIMAANLFITKKMSDEEKNALADYILSVK